MKKEEQHLETLFKQRFGDDTISFNPLPNSGSDRQYYRLNGRETTAIGVVNEDRSENEAFISFTHTFLEAGLPVPEILAEELEDHCYLISDLGDMTLFRYLTGVRQERIDFPDELAGLYQKVLQILPKFQIEAGAKIDYSKCYPRQAFDRQSMMWDLNYFKYYFLQLATVPYDEQALEDDFETFTRFLLEAPSGFFMYRDLQSRNIMLVNDDPYFIDYQGGRKGALQYDVASLLYDAKADIPQETRGQLLEFYLDALESCLPGKRKEFLTFFPGFILIRILQAMGAYGFRGYYEKKRHFLQSIPFAVTNLRNLYDLWMKSESNPRLPTLMKVLDQIIGNPSFQHPETVSQGLTVTINSFSYKNGIPEDSTENGGGFVFDCRALPNPGRYDDYLKLTGKDQQVKDFFQREEAVAEFMKHVWLIIDQSILNYLSRDFKHLFVNFGCTGGQHRSVYFAEKLALYLKGRKNVNIVLNHTNLPST